MNVPDDLLYYVGGSDEMNENTWIFQDSIVLTSDVITSWASAAEPSGTGENCLVYLRTFVWTGGQSGLGDASCVGPFPAMCERPIA